MIRPLIDNISVSNFLDGIFGPDNDVSESGIVSKITEAELTIKGLDEYNSTLESAKYRSRQYSSEGVRWRIRKQIVDELFAQKRLDSDDDIALGNGGALPSTAIKQDGQAYIVTGLPASGKSGISERIADELGAAILDSDYAKRKLPEYKSFNVGASIIHKESGSIVFGSSYLNNTAFQSLLERFSSNMTNIVLPKIEDTVKDLLVLSDKLKGYGYEVHLTLVSLDRRKATQRAIRRFENTGRYIPLSLIYDVYSNEPILTYYRIKTYHRSKFKSLGKISNDVLMNAAPFLDGDEINPAFLYK